MSDGTPPAQPSGTHHALFVQELLVTYGNGMVQHLGDEVDRIETELRRRFPSAKHIDLETD